MRKPHKGWHYALLAVFTGPLLLLAGFFTNAASHIFFGPVVPVLKELGYIPRIQPAPEPGELPFSIGEAFIAFFSAAAFWVFIFPIIVWIVAAVYLRWKTQRRGHADA
jgi:hypothetical protein